MKPPTGWYKETDKARRTPDRSREAKRSRPLSDGSSTPAAAAEREVAPANFVHGGKPADKIEVKLSYGIIARFSEGLYTSPNKAFEELVSNSYDAGASRVWIHIPKDLKPDAVIAVVDDGESMDLGGLHSLWEIGVSGKREDPKESESERPPIGKFGIGKLATYVLCNQLTYVCCRDNQFWAVTMDYREVEQQGENRQLTDAPPVHLDVVELTDAEMRETLDATLGKDHETFKILTSSKAPPSWTAAFMSSLRPQGQALSILMLKRILSTALPLHPKFKLWLNDEEVVASKAEGQRIWEWQIGASDALTPKWRYANRVETDAKGNKFVHLKEGGPLRGHAELFKYSLKTGKSEKWDRSYGFFVKVRKRVINLADPDFNIDVALRHGTFTRFRMEVEADGLDSYLLSPRESVAETPALKEVRAYLLDVFNKARVELQKEEEETMAGLSLTATDRVAGAPKALRDGPIRRVLKRVLDGDEDVAELVGIIDEKSRSAAANLIEASEPVLEDVVTESLGPDGRMVRFDPINRRVVLNVDHPFVNNYIDRKEAIEPLKLFGVTEFLTEIFLIDEDVALELVEKIRDRRDEFLKALASINPSSVGMVARALREAKKLPKELEDAGADALRILGYEVVQISGNDAPDGVATARLGARGPGKGSSDYAVTYDTKSIEKQATEKIAAGTAKTNVLKVHRQDHGADFTLLIAPGYQGEDKEKALIKKLCANDEVTPIKVEDLARLVELSALRPINPAVLRDMFNLRTVEDVRSFVNEMSKIPPSEPSTVLRILQIIQAESGKTDAVSHDVIRILLTEQIGREVTKREVSDIVKGLAALVPDYIWAKRELVALNASVDSVIKEIAKALSDLQDEAGAAFSEKLKDEAKVTG